jgi:acyl-CoA thioester hydrolase
MEINAQDVFSTNIEVRFADLDAYGHVNNAVFFT